MVWKPHVTVAAVAERDGRFLVVEEEIRGKPVDVEIQQLARLPDGLRWERAEAFGELQRLLQLHGVGAVVVTLVHQGAHVLVELLELSLVVVHGFTDHGPRT